ncbi:MAG: TIGR03364 family FAD-dependent oxidoreductase, partial [Chitinophagia bacterium]|nr:TIGR03364 family FAD-dependent oxidoreductase [Chitinophagia bacterium]
MSKKSAIVIGAGIVGLAAARALALQGYKVDVFEKNERATGASVRNFGMVWPVGQPTGKLLERAIRSRNIWAEICEQANIWHHRKGSLHLAYEKEEQLVIEEFVDLNSEHRNIHLLKPDDVLALSPAVNPEGLKSALYSTDELVVDARVAIEAIPAFFMEKMDINFHFLDAITQVTTGAVWAGKQRYEADEIYICSGAEFESLYPEVYLKSPLTRCKLQMMRSVPQPAGFNVGPSLCGGLTLISYKAFQDCPSLGKLVNRLRMLYPEYMEYGIHVLVAQNGQGE